ncbi:hypothetical protein J6590_077553 [Homalodisca vitripennis]|nr:hypothetical protein J6590_077553 [Homalodisca vitripennis]
MTTSRSSGSEWWNRDSDRLRARVLLVWLAIANFSLGDDVNNDEGSGWGSVASQWQWQWWRALATNESGADVCSAWAGTQRSTAPGGVCRRRPPTPRDEAVLRLCP